MAKISVPEDDDVGVVKDRRWNCLLQLTTLLAKGKPVLDEMVASQVVESPNSLLLAALDSGFLKKGKRSPRNRTNFLTKPRFKKPIQTPETLLSEAKEELVASPVVEIENNPSFLAALDRGFLKKGKRSLRNAKPRFKKPIDQSPNSTLCNSEKPRMDHQEKKVDNFKKRILGPNSALFINPNFEKPIIKKRKRCFDFGESSSKRQRFSMDWHIINNNIQSPNSTLCNSVKHRMDHQEKKVDNFKKRILSPSSTLFRNPNFEKPSKKRKICFDSGESSSERRRFFRDWHIIENDIQSLQTRSLLPEAAIRSRIVRTGGRLEGAVCVIEKDLFPTDVDTSKCRLSVPLRQVRERFLFPDEVELLLAHSDGGIRTTLIQPCLVECEITFGLWGSNTTYVLKNGWNDVCQKNRLRDGMHIRLWAFRRNSQLCFALELARLLD